MCRTMVSYSRTKYWRDFMPSLPLAHITYDFQLSVFIFCSTNNTIAQCAKLISRLDNSTRSYLRELSDDERVVVERVRGLSVLIPNDSLVASPSNILTTRRPSTTAPLADDRGDGTTARRCRRTTRRTGQPASPGRRWVLRGRYVRIGARPE